MTFIKGQVAWNKNVPMPVEAIAHLVEINSGVGNPNYGLHRTPESKKKSSSSLLKFYSEHVCIRQPMLDITKQKIRVALTGKTCPIARRKKIAVSLTGKIHSDMTKQKMRASAKAVARYGKDNPHWKGGVTSAKQIVTKSFEYIQWRHQIYSRDQFTCQECGIIGSKLNAHHIKAFSILIEEAIYQFPLLTIQQACRKYVPLWDTHNGITLCLKCHKQVHKDLKNKNK